MIATSAAGCHRRLSHVYGISALHKKQRRAEGCFRFPPNWLWQEMSGSTLFPGSGSKGGNQTDLLFVRKAGRGGFPITVTGFFFLCLVFNRCQ